jgi:hypothetical protein
LYLWRAKSKPRGPRAKPSKRPVRRPKSQAKRFSDKRRPPTVPELTDLINALTGAINAIKSAGPGLAGLGASILFLGIAAWAARGA